MIVNSYGFYKHINKLFLNSEFFLGKGKLMDCIPEPCEIKNEKVLKDIEYEKYVASNIENYNKIYWQTKRLLNILNYKYNVIYNAEMDNVINSNELDMIGFNYKEEYFNKNKDVILDNVEKSKDKKEYTNLSLFGDMKNYIDGDLDQIEIPSISSINMNTKNGSNINESNVNISNKKNDLNINSSIPSVGKAEEIEPDIQQPEIEIEPEEPDTEPEVIEPDIQQPEIEIEPEEPDTEPEVIEPVEPEEDDQDVILPDPTVPEYVSDDVKGGANLGNYTPEEWKDIINACPEEVKNLVQEGTITEEELKDFMYVRSLDDAAWEEITKKAEDKLISEEKYAELKKVREMTEDEFKNLKDFIK